MRIKGLYLSTQILGVHWCSGRQNLVGCSRIFPLKEFSLDPHEVLLRRGKRLVGVAEYSIIEVGQEAIFFIFLMKEYGFSASSASLVRGGRCWLSRGATHAAKVIRCI